MPPLKYHFGQTEIQAEAKTTPVAEKLAYWVGPVAEFAHGADLFLLATANSDSKLCFTVLFGVPPFFQVLGESGLRTTPDDSPEESAGDTLPDMKAVCG